jgi:ABC-type nitrate/sulfonate/bicarbonate transport system permease component
MAVPVEAVDVSRFEPSSQGSRRDAGGWKIHLWQLACFVVVLTLWALVSGLGLISAEALPSPAAVLRSFLHIVATSEFWQAVGDTLRGAVVGLAFAIAIGVPLGLITGTYAAAEQSSRLLVDFLRSFPIIALLPVFLLIEGSTPNMKATVVFIACLFPVFLQAQYGARSVSPMIAETIRSYRIPRLLRFARVIVPSATPSIMTGVRLAATTSVLVAIGVEILSTLPGIGHEVTQEQQAGNSATAFAYIFVSGLLGYGINRGSELVESVLLRWRPPAQAS